MGEKALVEKNSMLVKEFDRYILEHPQFADEIPDNALVVMQLKDDDEFNRWAREAARQSAEKNTPVLYVTITEIKPVRSRIERLTIHLAA